MESKPWYQSKGVLGSLATMAITVLGVFGIVVGGDLTSEEIAGRVADLVTYGIAFVTGLIGLVGRLRANTTITWRKSQGD